MNYRNGGLEDMTKFFLLDLILFLIIGGVAIILQYHFGNRLSKKVEIVYGCITYPYNVSYIEISFYRKNRIVV